MTPRTPGQHARRSARRLALRAVFALAALVLTGLAVGALAGFTSRAFVVAELGVIGATLAIGRFGTPAVERWARGATGEEHVGAMLDGLAADGWLAVHDLDTGRGNIDHVVVGPAGVFTVETKSHAGRIAVERIDERMLKQAYAQAKHVEAALGVSATPLLVFSRAYLVPAVSRRRGVSVLPARMVAGWLKRRAPVLEPHVVRALHARLAER